MRVLNVAAFAVSGYSSTDGRHCKPFNPLLGETYEADYPDKGLRFFSEKVSLHLNSCILILCSSESLNLPDCFLRYPHVHIFDTQ